jgi:hypothetical protein
MMAAVQAYLTLRRATGFDMSNAGYLLASFAGFAINRSDTHVLAETAIALGQPRPIRGATGRANENRLPLCPAHSR